MITSPLQLLIPFPRKYKQSFFACPSKKFYSHTRNLILHSVVLYLAFLLENIYCRIFHITHIPIVFFFYIHCFLYNDLIVYKMQLNATKCCIYSIACVYSLTIPFYEELHIFSFFVNTQFYCKFCTYILEQFYRNI